MRAEPDATGPELRACAVCGRVLFNLEGHGYIHGPQEMPEDHPAVPVTLDEVQAIGRCDFCGADFPAWLVPTRPFTMPGLPTTSLDITSQGDWSACDTCADLIRNDRWDALLRRAATKAAERSAVGFSVSFMKSKLAPLYNRIQKNVTGPPERAKR